LDKESLATFIERNMATSINLDWAKKALASEQDEGQKEKKEKKDKKDKKQKKEKKRKASGSSSGDEKDASNLAIVAASDNLEAFGPSSVDVSVGPPTMSPPPGAPPSIGFPPMGVEMSAAFPPGGPLGIPQPGMPPMHWGMPPPGMPWGMPGMPPPGSIAGGMPNMQPCIPGYEMFQDDGAHRQKKKAKVDKEARKGRR
jgi:hypothetical protein